MHAELATWLRRQRRERNWGRQQMARQLINAGQQAGDTSMPSLDSMEHNLHRWERGLDTPSERYMLYYCKALGITPGQYGPRPGQPGPSRAPGTA